MNDEMPGWMAYMPQAVQDAWRAAHSVTTTSGHVEAQLTQATSAFQHLVEQVVLAIHALEVLAIVGLVIYAGVRYYSWNLRRREVIAEEKQAVADARTATALEGILVELKKFNQGK